jgi:hypothetical protein
MATGRPGWHGRWRAALACALACGLAVSGCSFGPKALERTHGRYQDAVNHVYEEQLLRNLVHIRYAEAPLALDVTTIAAQHELSAQAEARPFFIAPNPSNSNIIFRTFTSILPDLQLGGSERPTVTFHPADDADAMRVFLTPITAETIVFLTQGGWPVASVLRLWVERLNGVPNAAGRPHPTVPDFTRFVRIAELMQLGREHEWALLTTEDHFTEVGGPLPAEAVTAAALVEAAKTGLEYRPRGDGKTWALVRKERKLVLRVNPADLQRPEVVELLGLLNLEPGVSRHEVIVTTTVIPDPLLHPAPAGLDLRVQPRSTGQVWAFLSNGVEVPAEHVRCGLARLPLDLAGQPFDGRAITQGLFTVHAATGHRPPPHAFVAVRFRDYWFYIDDRDQQSKATFALVLQLSRLDFGRQQRGGPALTLPVGR